ncbi:PKD domain-containing protein [Pseudofrankia inefficax]|uniref:PKD domain-containing protein n=1 Tax=Pseudofrankia inefficax (strain DSM 45817 / CECT 9037 / DDB 130130 / EuI1c) TaxID=298654 RepID=UPI0012FE5E8F|nr:PKD domain-containing protein [Pseudofrankia inefficax]
MSTRVRRWAGPAALVALLVAGVAALVAGSAQGVAARSVSLDDVSAWLLSPAVGEAELVDGNSGAVVTRVELGVGALTGTQSGTGEFVADSATGKLRRIDGATYRVSAPATFGKPGEALGVYPAGETVFAVDQPTGLVSLLDPRTLAVRQTYSLAAKVAAGGIVTQGADVLWAVGATTGDLERVDGSGTTIVRHAVDPARTTLVTAAGLPVAVDLTARQVVRLGSRGVTGAGTCVDVAATDSSVQVVGSADRPAVYAVSGSRGVLLVSDLATGRCGDAVNLGVAGHRLGQPREAAGRVFVPDYTSGQVLVVDVTAGRVIADPTVMPPSTAFELRDEGAVVFYNDPATAKAGVISLDGAIRPIEKYSPATVGTAPGGPASLAGKLPSDAAGGSQPPTGGTSPPSGVQPTAVPTRPAATRPQRPTAPLTTIPPVGAGPAVASNDGRTAPTTSTTTEAPATGGGAPTVRIAVSAPQARVGTALTMQAVLVAADGTVTAGKLAQVSWSFGDGGSATGSQVTHAWTASGVYTVSADVRLTDGTSAAPVTSVTVVAPNVPPVTTPPVTNPPVTVPPVTTPPTTKPAVSPLKAVLSANKGSCTQDSANVTVDASGSAGGSGPLTYAFDFGDGTTAGPASAATVEHGYSQTGPFTVTVTITDATGASAKATATATLLHLAASATSVTVGQSVTLTGTGVCAGASLDLNIGAQYAGGTSTSGNIGHNVHEPNPYTSTWGTGTTTVSAHWSESDPYSDSNRLTITVTDPAPPPPLQVTASSTSITLGQSVTLTATGGVHGSDGTYSWYGANPSGLGTSLCGTTASCTTTPDTTGTWKYSVQVYDNAGNRAESNQLAVTVSP